MAALRVPVEMKLIFTAGPRSTMKLLMKADADVKGRTLQEESQDSEVPEAGR